MVLSHLVSVFQVTSYIILMISNGNEISWLNGLFVALCGRKKMQKESQDVDANYRTNHMTWDELVISHLFSKTRGSITSNILSWPKSQGYLLICKIVNSIISRGPATKRNQRPLYHRHQIYKFNGVAIHEIPLVFIITWSV